MVETTLIARETPGRNWRRKMAQTTPPATTASKPRSRTMLYGIIVIILIVVGVGVYYLTVGSQSNANNGTPVSIFDTSGACTLTASPPNCGFSPQALNVKMGTNNTVTWTNNGQQAHTATSNSTLNGSLPSFDSGTKNHGEKFTSVFNTAGTYHYYCKFHVWMTGTVVVSA